MKRCGPRRSRPDWLKIANKIETENPTIPPPPSPAMPDGGWRTEAELRSRKQEDLRRMDNASVRNRYGLFVAKRRRRVSDRLRLLAPPPPVTLEPSLLVDEGEVGDA